MTVFTIRLLPGYVLFGFAICLAPAAWAAETNDIERKSALVLPENTKEQIVYEWSGGQWSYQKLSGSYRFVITQAADTRSNKLYLQWWYGPDQQKELAYSVSVRELNQAPTFSFVKTNCKNSRCEDFSLFAEHAYEGYAQVFEFSLDGLGHYKMSL